MVRWGALAIGFLAMMINGNGSAHAMDIQSGQLDNGMKVVVVPDHRAPVVVHSVWYTVGSIDEEVSRTGLSHMLEHMMFKGTEKYPPQVMDKTIQRNGGIQNAFTSRDMTAYHQTISKDKLPMLMDMEADRMTGLRITDALLTPEKNVVAEERRLRTDSQPQSRFFEALMKAHYPTHPYGNPVIGWREDIENYKLSDLQAWYKRHYAPNNAILLVVGDITLEELMPLAKQTYGAIAARDDVPARAAHVEPLRDQPVWLRQVDKDVQVPVFIRMYRAPSLLAGVAGQTPDARDVLALRVLDEVLGSSDASRLYQSLVVTQQLADGAGSDFDLVSGAEGTFDVHVTPKPGITMDTVDAAVNAEVAKLQAEPVTDDEMKRAKVNILADTVYAQDDNDTLLWQVGSWMLAGGSPETFSDWQDMLEGITAADVTRVAQTYLVPRSMTTGLLVQNEAQLGTLARQ